MHYNVLINRVLALILLGGVIWPLSAQSVSQIKADSDAYIWGEGYGVTQQEADEAALANLINQISVSVKSDFISEERERLTKSGSSISEKNYKSIIQTYSNATLHNTERLIIKQEPDAHVFRYLKRVEIDKIFKARRDKALEYVRLADDALKEGQIDDALKYYYWSLCLVRSLRYPSEAKIVVEGQEHLLTAYLPMKIEDVCSDISLKLYPLKSNVYKMHATYRGRPVRSMDYTYNDGMGYGATYSVRDGEGLIELLSSSSVSKVTVKLEYMFRNLAMVDSEVEELVKHQKDVFRKSYIDVLLSSHTQHMASQENGKKDSASPAVVSSISTATTGAVTSSDMNQCTERVLAIGEAMKNANLASVKSYFTDEGYSELSKILSYGRYSVLNNIHLECVENLSEGTIVCRGLPCLFRFSHQRTFNEQLSFTFKNGKINHVALGLGRQMTEEEIACHGEWGMEARKRIVSFLEDYRTAYATKNVDYMERVFDDNAVIIVGKTLKQAARLNDHALLNNQFVKLTQLSKEEFLRNLKNSFASKEYVNLHFSNCEIMQLSRGVDKYGIQLKQEYYSSNYGDTGYLYLLVDLTNPQQPVIHVRTWQPQPDPNFGVIEAGHF